MASSGGSSNLILLGAVAVGGYFLYQWYFVNGLPADAVYVFALPVGSTVQVPKLICQRWRSSNGASHNAGGVHLLQSVEQSVLRFLHRAHGYSNAARPSIDDEQRERQCEYADNVEYSCRDSDTCACYAGGHSRFDSFRPVSRQPLHPAEDFGNGRCQLYGLGRCALRHAVPLAVLR